MKRKILFVVGMLMSAGWGLAAYVYTCLADVFESEVVSYAIGFAVAVVFVSVFRSAYLDDRWASKEEKAEEEAMILCSECRRQFDPQYHSKISQSPELSYPEA